MKISFIGSGYVGLVSGVCMADFGHDVICMDIDNKKIEQLNKCKIPIFEPGLTELIKKNINEKRISFSSNIDQTVSNSDIIFIAVGTPSDKNGNVKIKYIFNAIKNIIPYIDSYKVIVIKSTVPPGTASKIKKYVKDLKLNNSLYDIVSNPEFLREGSAIKDFMIPDRIVIGSSSKKAVDLVKKIYDPLFLRDIPLIKTSHETAELVKYSTNAFLATKISFINEIGLLCNKLNADVKTISNSLGLDGRISPKFLHPGPGFGGSCFPKDTKALAYLSRSQGVSMKTVEAAIETNRMQKDLMVKKMKRLVGGKFRGKQIAILGLTFKPNTDDVRDSASINMINMIKSEGGDIRAYDPIANESMKSIFPDLNYYTSWEDACKNADGVAIMTEWNEFRGISLPLLKSLLKSPILLDTRNIFRLENLEKNNFTYENVGRSSI